MFIQMMLNITEGEQAQASAGTRNDQGESGGSNGAMGNPGRPEVIRGNQRDQGKPKGIRGGQKEPEAAEGNQGRLCICSPWGSYPIACCPNSLCCGLHYLTSSMIRSKIISKKYPTCVQR